VVFLIKIQQYTGIAKQKEQLKGLSRCPTAPAKPPWSGIHDGLPRQSDCCEVLMPPVIANQPPKKKDLLRLSVAGQYMKKPQWARKVTSPERNATTGKNCRQATPRGARIGSLAQFIYLCKIKIQYSRLLEPMPDHPPRVRRAMQSTRMIEAHKIGAERLTTNGKPDDGSAASIGFTVFFPPKFTLKPYSAELQELGGHRCLPPGRREGRNIEFGRGYGSTHGPPQRQQQLFKFVPGT